MGVEPLRVGTNLLLGRIMDQLRVELANEMILFFLTARMLPTPRSETLVSPRIINLESGRGVTETNPIHNDGTVCSKESLSDEMANF